MTKQTAHHRQPLYRWLLAGVMLTTLVFGWHWPLFGFTVPLAMLAGMGGGFWRGRYICGNLCPRGSFYDTFFMPLAGSRPIPQQFFALKLRWPLLTVMMALMALQLFRKPTDVLHWGWTFWLICLVTTLAGIILARRFKARAWCSLCPVGTLGRAAGGGRYLLTVGESCSGCRLCERVCPLDLPIIGAGTESARRDCLKCGACVQACPPGVLSFSGRQSAEPCPASD